MTTVDPRLKFQLPTIYSVPNECVGCGKTDNGNVLDPPTSPGMVDVQKDIDFYGAVYVCSDCSLQMARIFGAITPAEYSDMEHQLHLAVHENSELRKENLALKKVVDGYRELGNLAAGEFHTAIFAGLEESLDSGELVPGQDNLSGPPEQEEVNRDEDSAIEAVGSGVPTDIASGEGLGDSEDNESSDKQESGDVRVDPGDKLSELFDL